MNILFVTYDFPYPMTSGGKNRSYHLLKFTAKSSNIHLLSFVREDYDPNANHEILNLGVKSIKVVRRKKLNDFSNIPSTILHNSSIFKSLYYDPKVTVILKEIIKENQIDIVHYESSYTGFYIPKISKMHVKQVLGTENIEYQLYFDYAKYQKKFYLKPFIRYQAARLKSEELEMVEKADAVTTVTDQERIKLQEACGVKSYIVANGIDPDVYKYSYESKLKNNILFVGNFTYFPNIDAVNFFYYEVFKKIKRDITFTIIGKQANKRLKIDDKRVIKKDFVDKIEDEYKASDMLVFPIRIGGGTNFKVLEAMSLGTPIIAKPERLSGLNAIEGKHFVKADTASEYFDGIELLYDNKELRLELSKSARKLVEQNFRWDKIGRDLLSVWEKLI